MKTLFKYAAGIVVLLVVLVAAAAILLPRFIDADDIKARAVAQVKAATGRDLRIPGEIKLSVFPWLGLDAGEVALGNAAGFAGDTFARIERLSVRLQLMPLLSREVVMDTVVLHGLQVNLARDERGNGNWEDLSRHGDGGSASAGAGTGGSDAGGGAGLAGIAIGGLDIRSAALSFDDAQAGEKYSLANLDVTTGVVEIGKPVALEASFDLSGGKPAMQGHVEIAGTLSADPDAQRYRIDGLKVTTDITGDGLPGGKLAASLGADISADLKAQTLAVSGLVLEALGVKTSGELKVDKLTGAEPAFSGSLALAPFSPRELMSALGVTPPVTSDEKVLGNAEARLTLSGTPKAIQISSLEVKLDDTTLKGSLGIVDVARQALRFDLAGDVIDVDRYLPPPAAGDAAAGSGSAQTGSAATPASADAGLPMETLRALDIDGKFTFGNFKVMKLTVTDISLPVKAKGGLISLAPIAATLYKGSYAGNIALDARGEQPAISLDEKLVTVQIGPLLDDLQGGEGAVEGTADANAKLTMKGADATRIKQTLNGNVGFVFADGAVRGINIAQMIRGGLAKLKGGAADADAPRKTDFAELKGTANIKDGVVSNDDLSMKSPLLRIAGKGTANLPADSVDYRVTTTVVGTSQGQGGKELTQLAGVEVPILVTGSLSAPTIGPDMAALAVALAKGAAGDVIEGGKAKAVEKVTETVGGALGGALGNALGGGSTEQPAGDAPASEPAPAGGSGDAVGDTVNKLKGLFN